MVDTSYSLLGPLEVSRAGQAVPIRAGKLRVVLATLLVSANRLVPVDELVERLWSHDPPATARATLATYVMRLRRALGGGRDQGSGTGPIRTRPEGYLVEVPDDHVDLCRFTRLLAEADQHADDPETMVAVLDRALRLWRGPALVDIPSESLHRNVAPQLEEQRLHALERRITAELALGRHAQVVGELTALTSEHRLRERFWYQLMLALYRSHRQFDALEAYGRLRSLLVEELGLEPGAEIRELHQRILADDPRLHRLEPTRVRAGAQNPPVSWSALCQLPPDVSDFVGRDELIAEVTALLSPGEPASAVPIVTLTGTAGAGKSALAIRIAHQLRPQFPDGQLFVRLTGADATPRDPADALGELLTATGMGRDSLPDDLDARAAAFRARLADRAVLLVVDDAVSSQQVLSLLPGTPGCAVLVTGRRVLTGLPGSTVRRVDPLDDDAGLDLLARLVHPDRIAAEPDAARTLVRACGGLPLALRIVAARLAIRPSAKLATLAARLTDEQRRLDELRTADLEVRASLAVSYTALAPPAACAFRRLGLLGTVDVAAWTIGVLTDESDGERLVEDLLQANLLIETGRDLTGEPRYRAHDLPAVYAAELSRSVDPDAGEAALRRLVDALVALADAAYTSLPTVSFDEAPLHPATPPPVLSAATVERLTADGEAWMLSEQHHLDWAIRRCAERGWYLDAAHLAERALGRLDIQLPHHHVLELLQLVRAAAETAGDPLIAWRAAWQHSMQVATRSLTSEVLHTLEESARVFERLGATVELTYALAALAHFRDQQQRGDEALVLAERAVAVARTCGHRPAFASAVREYASLLAQQGRYADALPLLDEALTIARELGKPVDEALVLHRITMHALDNGDLDRASEASCASLAAVADVPEYRARAYVAAMAARVATARGDGAEAVRLAEQAREEFGRLGDRFGEVAALASLAEAYLAAGRASDVVTLVNRTLPAYADVGATRHEERLRRAHAAALAALDEDHGQASPGTGS